MRRRFFGLLAFAAICTACSNEQLDEIDHLRFKADSQLRICRIMERLEMPEDRHKAVFGSLSETTRNADRQLLQLYLNRDYTDGLASFRIAEPKSVADCVNTLADRTNDMTDAMDEDRSDRNPLFRLRGREVMAGVWEHLNEAEAWNAEIRRRNQRG